MSNRDITIVVRQSKPKLSVKILKIYDALYFLGSTRNLVEWQIFSGEIMMDKNLETINNRHNDKAIRLLLVPQEQHIQKDSQFVVIYELYNNNDVKRSHNLSHRRGCEHDSQWTWRLSPTFSFRYLPIP